MRETWPVRQFVERDADDVARLIERCLREVNSKDYSAEQIELMVPGFAAEKLAERFTGTYAVVATEGERVVGIGLLAGHEIRTMFVDPSFHGRGIGRAIIHCLEGEAVLRGEQRVELFASLTARRFYEKLGYTSIGVVEHEVAGRTFRMERSLTRAGSS
jgi:GNAT superfamily N-acetyltransferase